LFYKINAFVFSCALYLVKICIQREKADFDKLEHLRASSTEEVFVATERVRRVTWRMGVLGSAVTMFLLFCMGVTCSSLFSVGLVSWVTITGCLNFRAYHVEDIGMQHLKKSLEKIKN
jgi:hypothetical protein